MGATTTATFRIYFCRFSGVLLGLCRATKSEPFSVIGGGLPVGKKVCRYNWHSACSLG